VGGRKPLQRSVLDRLALFSACVNVLLGGKEGHLHFHFTSHFFILNKKFYFISAFSFVEMQSALIFFV